MSLSIRLASFCLLMVLCSPVAAQDDEVPYWASLRVEKANMRVGPSGSYRILWVYQRKQLPLKVLRRKEGWRLVEDPDGARGWIVGRFLSRDRMAIVAGDMVAEMREEPSKKAKMLWRVEPGVVGKLGRCENGWCRFNVRGHAGFIPFDRLWGSGEP